MHKKKTKKRYEWDLNFSASRSLTSWSENSIFELAKSTWRLPVQWLGQHGADLHVDEALSSKGNEMFFDFFFGSAKILKLNFCQFSSTGDFVSVQITFSFRFLFSVFCLCFGFKVSQFRFKLFYLCKTCKYFNFVFWLVSSSPNFTVVYLFWFQFLNFMSAPHKFTHIIIFVSILFFSKLDKSINIKNFVRIKRVSHLKQKLKSNCQRPRWQISR